MGQKKTAYAIGALIVAVIAIVVSYEKGWLNKILPAKWQKTVVPKAGFVGTFGRTPEMQGCLAYTTGADGRQLVLNRCAYV
jgi:hypothetical protein